MPRTLHKLTARTVVATKQAGRLSDGGGLYLIIDPSGAKRWLFMYRKKGVRREMGLGGLLHVSLAEAREKATAARQQTYKGVDPITARKAAKAVDAAQVTTFAMIADEVRESLSKGFKNQKHIDQWKMTLTKYADPISAMPVADVMTDDILGILRPVWDKIPETASRLRGRIEKVLDAAIAKGLRTGENPARWKGHLDHLLPPRKKLTRGHHSALPYKQVPMFVARLRESASVSNLALEFLILTALRTGEVRGAVWEEISLTDKVWVISPGRMKAGKEHRVPLTPRMIEIIQTMAKWKTCEYVFPGAKAKSSLSDMALLMNIRRLGITDITTHGFRSSFRDWAGEETEFPREIAEAALAHVVGDATERAYRRGDALQKRRLLMLDWESYISNKNS